MTLRSHAPTPGPRRLARALAAALLSTAATLATVASAADIAVFNTGVAANGTPLAGGATDPHWQVIAGPGITAPQAAVVVDDQHPFGNYFETIDSRWIWVEAGASVTPGGPFTFRLQFDLTGLDPASVNLRGRWGIDDSDATITLNGATPEGTGLSLLPLQPSNWNEEHPFTITGGFVPGINFLDITVTDVSNPGGLNVTGLVASVPELPSLALMAVGVAALMRLQRSRAGSAAALPGKA